MKVFKKIINWWKTFLLKRKQKKMFRQKIKDYAKDDPFIYK
jgi:hypothetical protein|tara:strand:- start:1144 stop:1266 length:123 start_codon:yes stop_codon:yes gene_type:complete